MTIKPRILQVGSFAGSPSADERLAEQYDVFELWKHEDRARALAEHGKGIEVIVTSANMGADAALINSLPDLKAVCSWGVGYDKLDVDAVKGRDAQASNTPDVLTDCVADLAWGLMLGAARRMGQGERFIRDGKWGQVHGSIPLGTRVSGKKLGVVGLGRIGEAIARRGQGFDMDVRYHSRRARNDSPYTYEQSLVELARWSDFLVIATVGGPSTHHLVSREVLQALGPKGIVVNIARGTVIDEQALVELLEQGLVGGAGLDVFEHEPKVPQALSSNDQVVVLPHIGSATNETRMDMENMLMQNIEAFFKTGKVITPIA